MRRVIILLIITVCIIIGVVWGLIWLGHYKTTFPVPSHRSNTDFSTAIIRAKPILATSKGQPIFDVVSSKKLADNWYLVTLRQKNTSHGIISEVIINDPYFDVNAMNLVAGPETNFSANKLTQYRIPQSVIKAIIK